MLHKLFDEEEKSSNESALSVNKRRVQDVLEPLLKGTGIEFDFAEKEAGEGVSIKLYTRKNPDVQMSVIPWVRPVSMTIRETVRNLGNYPRLNVIKEAKTLPDEEKIPYMIRMTKRMDLYFLIILPRTTGEPLLWLDRYDSIPIKKWKLTYRKDPKVLDRITLTKFKEPKFYTIKQVKEQIINILSDGNSKK